MDHQSLKVCPALAIPGPRARYESQGRRAALGEQRVGGCVERHHGRRVGDKSGLGAVVVNDEHLISRPELPQPPEDRRPCRPVKVTVYHGVSRVARDRAGLVPADAVGRGRCRHPALRVESDRLDGCIDTDRRDLDSGGWLGRSHDGQGGLKDVVGRGRRSRRGYACPTDCGGAPVGPGWVWPQGWSYPTAKANDTQRRGHQQSERKQPSPTSAPAPLGSPRNLLCGVGQVVATPITGSQRAAQASKARSPDAAPPRRASSPADSPPGPWNSVAWQLLCRCTKIAKETPGSQEGIVSAVAQGPGLCG